MKTFAIQVLLGLATVLSLIFVAAMLRQQLAEKREVTDRGMQATTRALTMAVDGEVKASLGILQTLAASPLLDRGDLKSFYELCVRSMEGRRGSYIILFDPSGQQLVNSGRPFGSVLPNPLQAGQPPGFDPRYREVPMGGAEPVKRVISTGKLFISNLFISLVTREPRIGFDIPVLREGKMRYILELSMDAAEFSRLLAEQGSPDQSVVAVVDRQGIVIATSVNSRANAGKSLAPELAGQIAKRAGGTGTGQDSDGQQVFHVFNTSALTGWRTSLAVPHSAAYAPLSREMIVLAAAAMIAILAASVMAVALSRRRG